MRSSWPLAALALALPLLAANWHLALPGYHYEFARDHFEHRDYEAEWWYYTGNLRDVRGRRFGFELTFFRFGTGAQKPVNPTWSTEQIYLTHLALSDIDGREFYHTERLNRAGPGLAGTDLQQALIWNGNWRAKWTSVQAGKQSLEAITDKLLLRIDLSPMKPFVIHGRDGVSQKGPEPGQASHYISFTRLGVKGQLQWKGNTFAVDGLAWMDHEFSSGNLNPNLAGWDWFAVQLENGEELMLYQLRNKSGYADPYSSGTYVDAKGSSHFLTEQDFKLTSGGEWKSPESKTRYPLEWTLGVPCLDVKLSVSTDLNNQEMFTKNSISPNYWEGAVQYKGSMRGKPVHGIGYLEMTGYDKGLQIGNR